MAKPELKAELDKRAADRAVAQKEIEALARQRDAYLADEAKKAGPGGFDVKVKAAVEKQLKK